MCITGTRLSSSVGVRDVSNMSRRVCVQCAETTMSRTANKHPFRVNIRLLVVTSVRVRRVLRTYLGISSIMHAAMCVRLDAESIYRILYITNNISKYPVGWARSRVNDQAEMDTGFLPCDYDQLESRAGVHKHRFVYYRKTGVQPCPRPGAFESVACLCTAVSDRPRMVGRG